MVNLGRILRDYLDAGSVNGLLALWGFVDDTTASATMTDITTPPPYAWRP